MGAANSPFAACQGVARDPNAPQVFSVVRSNAWGPVAEEDVWEVEVPGKATVGELKAQIQELYNVPRQMVRLARSSDASAQELEDDVPVETLERRRVHLLPPALPPALAALGLPGLTGGLRAPQPSAQQQAAVSNMMNSLFEGARESMEVSAALEESLKGVSYSVRFQRPSSAGGNAAGKEVTLTVDALAMVGNVQEMVELELLGDVGVEPAFLVFQGRVLPPHVPLHHAGVEDGAVVEVAKERPPLSEQEQLMAGLLGGNPGSAGFGLPPGLLGGAMGGPPPEQLQQMLAGLLGPPPAAGAPPAIGR